MGVPKQRHTKSRRNKRRFHIFLKAPVLVKCSGCAKLTLPHTVCQNCGYYKGTKVIDVLKKLTKKERKQKEKELKEKESESSLVETREDKGKKPLSWEELTKK